MATLPTAFNAYNIDPKQATSMLPVSGPEGHLVVISNSELKAASSGNGNGYLELTLNVVDGAAKGASGPFRLNLFNTNATAVEIANQHLSAICHVTGQMMVSDSAQLHNIPFRVGVISKTFKNAQGNDVEGTEIKTIMDIHGNKPKMGEVTGTAPQSAPPQPSFGAPAMPQQPAFAPQAPAQPAFAQPQQPAFQPPPQQPQGMPAGAPPWATK